VLAKTTFIYALRDPETREVRYVGKSNTPLKRLSRHKEDCEQRQTYQHRWMASLASRGLAPTLEILDEVLVVEWPQWEAAYIFFFRECGCRLTNTTGGGECGPDMTGRRATPEARNNMSKAKRGVPWSEERKRASRGRTRPPEVGAKISASKTGKKFSEDHRRSLSQSQMGSHWSEKRRSRFEEKHGTQS
jgi:hypothetical protein